MKTKQIGDITTARNASIKHSIMMKGIVMWKFCLITAQIVDVAWMEGMRMAEYIERNKLLHKIRWASDPEDCVMIAKRMPASDVARVRHGRWVPFYESEISGFNPKFAGCDPIAGYKCSECGVEAILDCNDQFVLSDFCPKCGARMDRG